MSITKELDRLGIEGYLDAYSKKELLRFLTCGSVDDGKSTLIGRLLHDSNMVYEDQLAAAKRDSARFGTTGEEIDFALLVDGLEAERQQGITIDVAYRYFTTPKRKFIIADTPGHEQYTRNMATGASNCDLAVILIDARKGVLDQTRRHSFIVALLGIKHVVVAVNKMDLVEWSQPVYEKIRADYVDFAAKLALGDAHFIPMAARFGDNVVFRSEHTPWYQGPPLLDYLETVHIASDRNLIDFRMPVQNVLRPNLDFRGFAGTIASGTLSVGDEIVSLPSGRQSRVRSIITCGREIPEAFAPMAVTVTLADEIDASRGDVFAPVNNTPRLETRIEAMVVWMANEALESGKSYLLKHTTNTTSATVTGVRYKTNVNTLHQEKSGKLALNEIGRVEIETMRPLAVDPYRSNRQMGAFILVDRMTNATVGAGMIVDRTPAEKALSRRRSSADAGKDVRKAVRSAVSDAQRKSRLGQEPFTLWFTGLPRSGKTSIAFALEQALFDRSRFAHVLDGERLRSGLSSDLGFSAADRWEHQRRAAEVAHLQNDLGLITIVALISPIEADRAQAQRIVGSERFLEVHCDAPIEVCEARDVHDLYGRARRGEISGLTGVDAPYEPPRSPFLRLDTAKASVSQNVARLIAALEQRGLL
ncbi:MAG: sulfate adenylyltransferase subunit CysN [Planctomycetes bacterium]|nr:sulfate adenylyltransferase subunit CysN [Planctomycetota bacterium]